MQYLGQHFSVSELKLSFEKKHVQHGKCHESPIGDIHGLQQKASTPLSFFHFCPVMSDLDA